jgi:hypothetical protein
VPRVTGRRLRAITFAAAIAVAMPVTPAVPTLAGGPELSGIEIEVPTGNRIGGTVKNGDGAPIPGMAVIACTVAQQDCRSDATTAANGSYTIRGLIADTYAIGFFPPDNSDYVPGWYTPTGPVDDFADATAIDVTAGDVSGVHAVAITGFTISGTITGPGAVPLAGVDVSANGQSSGGAVLTDASGNYAIRGLVDDTYMLSIRVPPTMNYRSGSVVDGGVIEESNAGSPVVVTGADVTGVNVIAPAGLRMSGTLSGPEAAGSTVSAYGASNSDSVTVAANGQWSIKGLWPGEYVLVFSPAQANLDDSVFALGYWSGGPTLTADYTAAETVVLTSTNATGLNATIPDGRSIAGTVVGEDGSALPDAYIIVCGLASGCASGRTNLSGVWSFHHVVPDSYLINVSHPESVGGFFGSGSHAIDESHAKRVTVSTADVSGVDIVLPSGATITGHIVGPDAEAVAGAHVSAFGTGGTSEGAPGSDETAGDGSFVLRGLSEDDYVISVSFGPYSDYLRGYFDDSSPQGYTDDYDLATLISIGDAAIGSSYVPIAPKRVVDSRIALGVSGAFSANVPRSFQVAGISPIPANAVAVTGNVTVVNQTSAGYVSLTPTATASPKSSTINFPVADVRANNFTIPLDATGKMAGVFKAAGGKTVHVIVDVTGYFVAGDTHATYAPIAPIRVLDSRTGKGLFGPFVPNVPKTLSIAAANGIPADAIAVTANLTVVGQTRAGYLSVTPNPSSNPSTSTINFPVGDTRANGLTARLNGSGDLSIVYKASGGSTHVVLDVTGYYRNNPGGLLYYPLSPGRIVDTRPGILASELVGAFSANGSRTLDAVGHARVPLLASALTGNVTVVGQTSGGYVSITREPVPNPTTSTINFPVGDSRANGATVPLNGAGELSFVFKAPTGRTTHLIFDVTGYFR